MEGRRSKVEGRVVERNRSRADEFGRDLKQRSKKFSIDAIRFVDLLPRNVITAHIGRQLLRSATSMAANYRAACRGRSYAELFSKLCICEEEADETLFWLEILEESGKTEQTVDALWQEADELLSIFVAAKKTLKAKSVIVREQRRSYKGNVSEPWDIPLSASDLSEIFDLRPSTFP